MVLACIVLGCLVAATAVCVRQPSLLSLVLLGLLALLWLLADGPLEGAVLIRVTKTHGLTLGDLAVVVVVPALWSYTRAKGWFRRPPEEPARDPGRRRPTSPAS